MKLLSMAFAAFAVAATASSVRAADTDDAVYVVTYVDVMPAARAPGIAAIRAYRAAAAAETGNRAITTLQETARAGRFVIVETWDNQADFAAHQAGATMQHFHAAVAPIQHSPADQRVHRGFLVSPAAAAGQVYVVTHVDVVPPRQADAESALRALVEQSRRDPGNLRYDVFQQSTRPNHFTVYAVWRTQADFAAHERTAHRLRFRETIASYLGALYDERIFTALK